jgi:PAN domain
MVDRSYGGRSRSAKLHFWGLGSFKLLLIGGLAGYLLHLPANLILEDDTFSEVATVPAKLVPRPPPRPEITGSISSPSAARNAAFATYDNRDMFGGDYDTARDVSQAQCENRCRSDRRCLAYTFNKWQGVCFLKSSLGVVRIEPQGITGVASSEPVKQDRRAPQIQKSPSNQIGGYPYEILETRGYDSCAAACLADEKCLGANFTRTTRSCALMASLGKPKPAKAIDAGVKLQRSPSPHQGTRAKGKRAPQGPMPPEVETIFDAVVKELSRR